jgi:hypothetical protein
MKDSSNDFMVDIVNSDTSSVPPEIMLAGIAGLVLVIALVWWYKRR